MVGVNPTQFAILVVAVMVGIWLLGCVLALWQARAAQSSKGVGIAPLDTYALLDSDTLAAGNADLTFRRAGEQGDVGTMRLSGPFTFTQESGTADHGRPFVRVTLTAEAKGWTRPPEPGA